MMKGFPPLAKVIFCVRVADLKDYQFELLPIQGLLGRLVWVDLGSTTDGGTSCTSLANTGACEDNLPCYLVWLSVILVLHNV